MFYYKHNIFLSLPGQCSRKTFMIHQTFVRWALHILFKFVKSLIRYLGLAIGNVRCVGWFSWTLHCLVLSIYVVVVVSFISNRIQQWNNTRKKHFVDISKHIETLLHLSVVTREVTELIKLAIYGSNNVDHRHPCLPWGWVLATCTICGLMMQRKGRKCSYILMFPE